MKLKSSLQRFLLAAIITQSPVLYIVAHPDDETLFGGTLGKLKERGHPVYGIYITRGEGGKVNKVTGNAADNYKMRPLELKKAAERYGVKEVLLLNQPDQPMRDKETGKPTSDVRAFLDAKVWNLPWIKERISSYMDVIRPKIILTLDPHSKGVTHAHHQATAQIALEMIKSSTWKNTIDGIYGAYEINQYPEIKFAHSKDVIHFDTQQFSRRLGMTYRKFQAIGASAHQTQESGHKGELPIPTEKWEPLLKEKKPGLLKSLLSSRITETQKKEPLTPTDVRVIEEQDSR